MNNKLKFEKHIFEICKRRNDQLNAISRSDKFLGQKKQEILIIKHLHILTSTMVRLYDTLQPAKRLKKTKKNSGKNFQVYIKLLQ